MSGAFQHHYFGSADKAVPSKDEMLRTLAPYKKHLVRFIEALPQGASVLDVGCGSGKAIKMIRALRPDVSVAGMDITDLSAYMPEGVPFIVGSVEELDRLYPPRSFDAVICQHVIEHLAYPLRLMEGISSVLKDGGQVFIETPNWTRVFVPFSNVYFWNDYTHVHPYSRAALHRLFADYGYAVRAITTTSSSTWLLPPKPGSAAGKPPARSHAVPQRGLAARIAARLINPLLRDMLIGIAVK